MDCGGRRCLVVDPNARATGCGEGGGDVCEQGSRGLSAVWSMLKHNHN